MSQPALQPTVSSFVSESPDVYDRWENVSLLLIESLSPLEAPVA